MKGKLLFAIALIAAASSNVFSMEIVKGKLLTHKEWTTGNVKSIVKDINIDSKKTERLLSQHKNDPNTYVYSHARFPFMLSPIIRTGEIASIDGQTSTIILNNATTNKIYTITDSVCSDTSPEEAPQGPIQLRTCSFRMHQIFLDAGGYIVLAQNPGVTRSFDEAGTYNLSVSTSIISDDNEHVTYSTSDEKRIYVSPAQKKS